MNTLYEDQYKFMNMSLSLAHKKSCRENQNTFYVKKVFITLCLLWNNVAKYCGAGQISDEKMAQMHCMLDT
jgi:hypothetical protein